MFALVLFVFLAGTFLSFARIMIVRKSRAGVQELFDGDDAAALKSQENLSDAFENLFEVPVLFYALVVSLYATQLVDPIFIAGAWAFVFFRLVQGVIHSTYNTILHRATAFWFGCLVLFAMWVRFALELTAR